MIKKKAIEALYGERPQGISYSSDSTRYASLHGFMGDAEFNEVNEAPVMPPGVLPPDYYAMNIRSGVNRTDCPSVWGLNPDKGLQRIGSFTFTPENIVGGWVRRKGEPVG